jgi:AraC-like DNA-binding protein
MSRIQSLDEITDRLGAPAFLRWVEAPYGAAAAVVRFRHRGAVVDISASSNFRLIFHLSPSQIVRQDGEELSSQNGMPIGSIVASFTQVPERIHILSAADTLHLLFSSELVEACAVVTTRRLSPRTYPALQAGAVQTLVAAALGGTDTQMQQTIASVARTIVDNHGSERLAAGGLAPQANRAIHELIEKHLRRGVSVPELAEAAGLSVHHFIKSFRQSEGFTPHALLLQRRMERAIGLLLNRKESVEEIALMVGFSSPSHFISTFRKLVGVTPSLLRRAARP